MRIAMMYGPFCSQGRAPYDIAGLYKTYGLTGSESSFFNLARGLAERGHEVAAFCECTPGPGEHGEHDVDGATVLHSSMLEDGGEALAAMEPDAVLAWNEPDLLRIVRPGVLRVVAQQLNDWSYCAPGFADFVDVFVCPSENHRQYQGREHLAEVLTRGVVIHNSINLEYFDSMPAPARDPHRVVWCSSPDRGLHHLLGMWPEIKNTIPEATLHVFYRVKSWLDALRDTSFPTVLPNARRARYVDDALNRLVGERWGVTLHDSVPNEQMARELRSSAVLAYTCDPIRYTEGFGVSVLDAAAAGCYPIITDADALPECHGDAAEVIHGDPTEQRSSWVAAIAARLLGEPLTDDRRARMRRHAERNARSTIAVEWETMLIEKLKSKSEP